MESMPIGWLLPTSHAGPVEGGRGVAIILNLIVTSPPAHSSPLTVGVIGGMGPLAIAIFMQKLIAVTIVEEESDHLHILVDSNPSIPDRTAFLNVKGPDPRSAIIAMP